MKLDVSLESLVELVTAGIVAGLEDAHLVPANIGHTSLVNMAGADARIRWATDRARNIVQGITYFEVSEIAIPDGPDRL